MINFQKLYNFNVELHALADSILSAEIKGDSDRSIYTAFAVAKGYKTHEAILLLCKHGYGEDAFMLARTLTELSIQASYILKDEKNERLLRYIEHDWVIRKQMYEYICTKDDLKKELSNQVENEPDRMRTIEQVEMEYRRVMDKYKYHSKNEWSDKKMFDMAEEIGKSQEYRTVYKLQCILSHTNVRSTNDYIKEVDGVLEINIGPDEESVEQALVASFDFFRCLLQEGIRQFGFKMEKKFESLCRRFAKQVR